MRLLTRYTGVHRAVLSGKAKVAAAATVGLLAASGGALAVGAASAQPTPPSRNADVYGYVTLCGPSADARVVSYHGNTGDSGSVPVARDGWYRSTCATCSRGESRSPAPSTAPTGRTRWWLDVLSRASPCGTASATTSRGSDRLRRFEMSICRRRTLVSSAPRCTLKVGVASLLPMLALVQGLVFPASADAAVANNGNAIAYPWSDCTVTVGDEASPQRYGIGDSEVSCRSRHAISLYTQLIRNGTVVAASQWPAYRVPNARVVERPTGTYARCDGAALWETAAWVWVQGQRSPQRFKSRAVTWAPC